MKAVSKLELLETYYQGLLNTTYVPRGHLSTCALRLLSGVASGPGSHPEGVQASWLPATSASYTLCCSPLPSNCHLSIAPSPSSALPLTSLWGCVCQHPTSLLAFLLPFLPSLSFNAWWSDRAVCPQFASEFLPLALQGRYFQKGGVKITQWHLKGGTERITWQHGQEHQTHQLWVVLGRERSTWSQNSDFLMMLEVGHVWTFTKNSEKLGILV